MTIRLPAISLATLCLLAGSAAAQDTAQEGRKLFNTTAVPACAVCHALQDAGAQGAIGPNLDELQPDAARVSKAVRNGIGQMPPFKNLSDAQIEVLSKYVENASRASK